MREIRSRLGGRYCSHCDDRMPSARRDTRGNRTLGLCIKCMRDPDIAPRCKGVTSANKPCKAIAYEGDYCVYHDKKGLRNFGDE